MVQTQGTKEWACKNINFSKGCSNNCQYCYARRIGNRFGWKKWNDWKNMINRHEIGKKRFQKANGVIMSPSSHDITLTNVKLAKKVFLHILEAGNELLIVSKPNLKVIAEIADFIEEYKELVLWRFTIGTLNEKVREYWEPGAPPIINRLKSLEYLYNNDWATSVSIEPFLDRKVVKLIKRLESFVSHTIWVGPMNKIHVPKELWTDDLTEIYSPENLLKLKYEIDNLKNLKIRYKDHFLTILKKNGKKKKKKVLAYH